MPRTVVPPPPSGGAAGAAPPAAAAPAGGAPGAAAAAEAPPGDRLPDKLVKYVPAETLAFFVPISAAIGSGDEGWLIAVIAIAALGTLGYLWQAAPDRGSVQAPRIHFYVLAEIALVCWMLGTSGPAEKLVGISQSHGGILLGIAAFLVPVTDGVLNRLKL